MSHKFNFGDIVECEFSGGVEGVPVTVRKRLFVQGLAGSVSSQFRGLQFVYTVTDNDPTKFEDLGRTYTKNEFELIPVEPLVQEIERNTRKFIASQPAAITTRDLQRIF